MGLSAGLAWVGVSSCGTFAEGWEQVDDCAHTNEPPTSDIPVAFPLPGWSRSSSPLAQDTGGDMACHS